MRSRSTKSSRTITCGKRNPRRLALCEIRHVHDVKILSCPMEQTDKPVDHQTNKLPDQQTSKPANQQTSRPADQKTNRPADQQASRQQTSRPANQQTNRPADQQASRPADQPTSRPANQQLRCYVATLFGSVAVFVPRCLFRCYCATVLLCYFATLLLCCVATLLYGNQPLYPTTTTTTGENGLLERFLGVLPSNGFPGQRWKAISTEEFNKRRHSKKVLQEVIFTYQIDIFPAQALESHFSPRIQ